MSSISRRDGSAMAAKTSMAASSLLCFLCPGHSARLSRGETLVGYPERRVHPRSKVFEGDHEGQLHDAVAPESALQVGDLLVGRRRWRRRHRVGICNCRALIIGKARRGGVVLDLLQLLDVEPVEPRDHFAKVDAPGAAEGRRDDG